MVIVRQAQIGLRWQAGQLILTIRLVFWSRWCCLKASVAISTIYEWLTLLAETNSLDPRGRKGGQKYLIDNNGLKVLKDIMEPSMLFESLFRPWAMINGTLPY